MYMTTAVYIEVLAPLCTVVSALMSEVYYQDFEIFVDIAALLVGPEFLKQRISL